MDLQSQKREDPNLDRLIAPFTPNIRQLSCSKNSVEVETIRDDVLKGSFKSKVEFSDDGQTRRVTNHTYETVADQLSFDSATGQPDYLLHSGVGDVQQKFSVDDVAKTNLYFWRNNKWPTGSIPTESFRWARSNIFLLDFQSNVKQLKRPRKLTPKEYQERNGKPLEPEYTGKSVNQLYECCQDKVCQDFFAKRDRVADDLRKPSKSTR